MRGLLIAAGIIAALYVADQQYANGKYTSALGRMVTRCAIRSEFRRQDPLQRKSPATDRAIAIICKVIKRGH